MPALRFRKHILINFHHLNRGRRCSRQPLIKSPQTSPSRRTLKNFGKPSKSLIIQTLITRWQQDVAYIFVYYTISLKQIQASLHIFPKLFDSFHILRSHNIHSGSCYITKNHISDSYRSLYFHYFQYFDALEYFFFWNIRFCLNGNHR